MARKLVYCPRLGKMNRGAEVNRIYIYLLFPFLVGYTESALSQDKVAGEARYKETCINCHGPAGKGVASYPKISGNETSYTIEKLEAYRKKIKQGPNSALMIMMARELSDKEISDLAAYLKDAVST